MTLEDAKKILKDLSERLHESAAIMNKERPALSMSREKDALALDMVLSHEEEKAKTGRTSITCTTCGT